MAVFVSRILLIKHSISPSQSPGLDNRMVFDFNDLIMLNRKKRYTSKYIKITIAVTIEPFLNVK